MEPLFRRDVLRAAFAALAAVPLGSATRRLGAVPPTTLVTKPERKFTLDFVPGRLGIDASQDRAIELAAGAGFESVVPIPGDLSRLDDAALTALMTRLSERKLAFGAADLPVDFRGDEELFRRELLALPRLAASLQRVGAKRVGTWIRPSHDRLTYNENFRRHARRLREVARILDDHGQRLGLEYVGPRLSWTSSRHAFIHTLAETRELIAAIEVNNVGLVLDSWHWFHAEEDVDDITSLEAKDIVAVDLNDAPRGLAREAMPDQPRELPAATGVIDVKAFLGALLDIGYDGPVRAEPFRRELGALPPEEAARAAVDALRAALAAATAGE
jgi:sugar phosphate isomerase/epimerase